MASTTVPDVKEALLEMFKGIPTLADNNVDIRYAENAERRRSSVWMGETNISEIEPAGFRGGRSRRHESFTVDVYVEGRGLGAMEAEQTAFSYAGAIEQALADDPKVDNTPNLSWAFVEEIQSNTAETGETSYCVIVLTVRCQGNFL